MPSSLLRSTSLGSSISMVSFTYKREIIVLIIIAKEFKGTDIERESNNIPLIFNHRPLHALHRGPKIGKLEIQEISYS